MRALLTLLLIAALLGIALTWQAAENPEPALATAAPADDAIANSGTPSSPVGKAQTSQPSTMAIHEQLDPAVVREVNERLAPAGERFTEVIDGDEGFVDLGTRSSSVSVAVIDENGKLVVTDFTQPIPEP